MNTTMITLPSGTNAELKPISAEEDLILRDQKLLRKGLAVDRVLEACVTTIGEDTTSEDTLLDLTALDRSVLLLELQPPVQRDDRATFGV